MSEPERQAAAEALIASEATAAHLRRLGALLRNSLVHDYAPTGEAFADHPRRAFDQLDRLLDTHAALARHLRVEGLAR